MRKEYRAQIHTPTHTHKYTTTKKAYSTNKKKYFPFLQLRYFYTFTRSLYAHGINKMLKAHLQALMPYDRDGQ